MKQASDCFSYKYKFAQMKPRLVRTPWWSEHIPFAFQLVEFLAPRIIVEIGVYRGTSFVAFCQAAQALQLDTKCYGVDTWQGDIHIGRKSSVIYKEISEYCEKTYPGRAILMRKNSLDAAMDFDDGIVDLLHIDGLHTFEGVKGDFDAWLPKMSRKGVMLFHDTLTKDRFIKVRKFYDSVKEKYPSIEFRYSYGLGVLMVGNDIPASVMQMVQDAQDPAFFQYFKKLGRRILVRYILCHPFSFNVIARMRRMIGNLYA